MREKGNMLGLLTIIVLAVWVVGCMLSITYLNLPGSLSGLLAALAVALAWLLVANLLIDFLHKKEKNKTNKNIGPTVFYSSKAIHFSDRIESEFRGFVRDIAAHQAKLDGKECTTDGRRELPEEKLISEKNMEDAFQRAVNELRVGNSDCRSCGNSLLDKIKNLRKKYEVKTP